MMWAYANTICDTESTYNSIYSPIQHVADQIISPIDNNEILTFFAEGCHADTSIGGIFDHCPSSICNADDVELF